MLEQCARGVKSPPDPAQMPEMEAGKNQTPAICDELKLLWTQKCRPERTTQTEARLCNGLYLRSARLRRIFGSSIYRFVVVICTYASLDNLSASQLSGFD